MHRQFIFGHTACLKKLSFPDHFIAILAVISFQHEVRKHVCQKQQEGTLNLRMTNT